MEAAVDAMLDGLVPEEEAEEQVDAWAQSRARTLSMPPKPRQKSTHRDNKENTPQPGSQTAGPSAAHPDGAPRAVTEPVPADEPQSVVNARRVIAVFERVYPRWQELVKLRGEQEARPHGLERFDEGWVLTRIVYKGEP